MRIFVVLFTGLLLSGFATAESSPSFPLLPMLAFSPQGEGQIRASSNVLLAVREADREASSSATPETTVQVIPWSLDAPRQTRPDWPGLVKDSVYIVGLHWTVIGILYVMPESVSGWSEEQKNANYGEKWLKNVKQIVWDHDDFYINYVLHPYWGATYYTRGRERGLSKPGAFWFSFLHSTLYEFGSEAFFEEPSIQDMVVTPVFGSLLGIYFEQVRDRVKQRTGPLDWRDKTILITTDPLGGLSYLIDRLFRVDSSIRIETTPSDVAALAALDENAAIISGLYQSAESRRAGSYLGLSLQVRF